MACSSHVGASYPVFVHRLALLLRASFGPSVAGTPLRFANPSPPSGWVEDFHFRAAGHAQHTSRTAPLLSRLRNGSRTLSKSGASLLIRNRRQPYTLHSAGKAPSEKSPGFPAPVCETRAGERAGHTLRIRERASADAAPRAR